VKTHNHHSVNVSDFTYFHKPLGYSSAEPIHSSWRGIAPALTSLVADKPNGQRHAKKKTPSGRSSGGQPDGVLLCFAWLGLPLARRRPSAGHPLIERQPERHTFDCPRAANSVARQLTDRRPSVDGPLPVS
jgi:hypothetical protein